eukprot:scaffold116506_cov42-Phaeocystis_antarctica.AAC.2
MLESGSCGGALITSKSECEAAATALGLSETTAFDFASSTRSYYPPGCFISYYSLYQGGVLISTSGYLYVFGDGSSGSCSSSWQCICLSPPPPP